MQQTEESDDLADISASRCREDDPGMRVSLAVESKEIGILGENDPAGRSGILQLLNVLNPDKAHVCL